MTGEKGGAPQVGGSAQNRAQILQETRVALTDSWTSGCGSEANHASRARGGNYWHAGRLWPIYGKTRSEALRPASRDTVDHLGLLLISPVRGRTCAMISGIARARLSQSCCPFRGNSRGKNSGGG